MAKSSKTPVDAKEVKSIAMLHEELAKKTADLMDFKRSHKQGELANPRAISTTKKEIARILTAIKADEITSKVAKEGDK